ncbi:AraC-like DNA-binding protein [Rubricella aquisinus]|uniref:AraC-like DNA-binding protein n=1 Tax=Rubricella aquisinus TaxID=2028108 RepID=A0A840WLZ6_9RHOB|nr:AraC family transcriptional regulator [Rubricella aquisinus]MBB5516108.1 AraC-like DNA-binding protein [Rubricella aquisinus]
MTELDLLLRGGTAALCLFVATRWLMGNHTHLVPVFGAAFKISVGIYIIVSYNGLNPDGFHAPCFFCFLGKLPAPLFWLFTLALFDDRFEIRWYHALPILATGAIHYGVAAIDPQLANLLGHLLMVMLFTHVIVIAIQSGKCDLVDTRILFRKWLTVLVPVVGIAITITDLIHGGVMTGLASVLQTAVIFAVAFWFAMWSTQIDGALVDTQTSEPEPSPDLSAPDRIELRRLNQAVEDGICFEPGLTISLLAERVDIPEHRLRRLINQGLGYRNFNAFLNDHRIAEAQRRLSDPARAREQIIQHAYALGYASLAPFNRAFRERLGTSPSAYRSEALDRVLAE